MIRLTDVLSQKEGSGKGIKASSEITDTHPLLAQPRSQSYVSAYEVLC